MNIDKKLLTIVVCLVILSQNLMRAAPLQQNGSIAVCSVSAASAWSEPNPQELGACQGEPAKILPPLPLLGSVNVPHHVTQLLYGERVKVCAEPECNGWVKIQTLEQIGFDQLKRHWCYVYAWVRGDNVLPVTAFTQPNVVVTHQWATVYARPDPTSCVYMHIPFASLLCGSKVEQSSGWYCIELYDGRIGFVHAGQLAELSAVVRDANIATIRTALVNFAHDFVQVKSLYLWGGRSPANPENFQDVAMAVGSAASVDCSGLINLVYRACGLSVPRNSYAQFLKATPVEPARVQPGDLIFLEIANAFGISRVRHVLMYIGTDAADNALLIESTGGDAVKEKCTRVTTMQANFGVKNLKHVTNGQTIARFEKGQKLSSAKIYCGTFLDREHLQERRTELLVTDHIS
ncbi:MAG: NlpC/P60 family protein [Candidatus Babeliales bacterium]|jgi:cell wall-associated NlpC family hydrolase